VKQLSIKPVEFQVMLPKTSEVSKMNSDQMNKNLVIQQQQSQMFQQKSEVNTRQVHAQDKAYEVTIKERQEKNKREGQKKDNKKDSENHKEKSDTGIKTSKIDIRI